MSNLKKFAKKAKARSIVQLIIGVCIILGFFIGSDNGAAWFLGIIFGLFFLFLSFLNHMNVSIYETYISYFNDNNDGIFHHYLRLKSNVEYEIYVDENNRTIKLKSGGRSKTFNFSDIKGYSYTVPDKVRNLAPGRDRNEEASIKMDAAKFTIKTTDYKEPTWDIKFTDTNGPANSKSPRFFEDVLRQCEAWSNVFEQVVRIK